MGHGKGRGSHYEPGEQTYIDGVPYYYEDAGWETIVSGCGSKHGLEDSALEDFFRDILTEQVDGNSRYKRYDVLRKFINQDNEQ
jgi:hypothetical protein